MFSHGSTNYHPLKDTMINDPLLTLIGWRNCSFHLIFDITAPLSWSQFSLTLCGPHSIYFQNGSKTLCSIIIYLYNPSLNNKTPPINQIETPRTTCSQHHKIVAQIQPSIMKSSSNINSTPYPLNKLYYKNHEYDMKIWYFALEFCYNTVIRSHTLKKSFSQLDLKHSTTSPMFSLTLLPQPTNT